MNASDHKLKEQLTSKHGPIAFATVARLGAIACTTPSEERYLTFLSAIGDPGESSGVAREQLVVDTMVYPDEPEGKAKARRFLQAMPALALQLSRAIEVTCSGDYKDGKPSAEECAALDAKYEFGWKVFLPVGFDAITLATDPTAGTLARGVIEASERGDDDMGPRIRTAVLSFCKKPERSSIELLISQRPAILVPLWVRCQQLAGVGAVELGND